MNTDLGILTLKFLSKCRTNAERMRFSACSVNKPYNTDHSTYQKRIFIDFKEKEFLKDLTEKLYRLTFVDLEKSCVTFLFDLLQRYGHIWKYYLRTDNCERITSVNFTIIALIPNTEEQRTHYLPLVFALCFFDPAQEVFQMSKFSFAI